MITARKGVVMIFTAAGGTPGNQGAIHLTIAEGHSGVRCHDGPFHANTAKTQRGGVIEIPEDIALRTSVPEDREILHPVVAATDINQHITAVGNINRKRIRVIKRAPAYTKDIDVRMGAGKGNPAVLYGGFAGGGEAAEIITHTAQIAEFPFKIFGGALMQGAAKRHARDIRSIGIDPITVIDLPVGIGQIISGNQDIPSAPGSGVQGNANAIILEGNIPPCRQTSFSITVTGGKVVTYKDVVLHCFTKRTLRQRVIGCMSSLNRCK